MSIDTHDDKFPESDRTLGEKLTDAAEEVGDTVKAGWDALTDDERLKRETAHPSDEGYGRHDIDPGADVTDDQLTSDAPSSDGYGRHDIDPDADVTDPAPDPVEFEGDSPSQSGDGYGRHDTDRRDNPVDPAFDPVIRFDDRT